MFYDFKIWLIIKEYGIFYILKVYILVILKFYKFKCYSFINMFFYFNKIDIDFDGMLRVIKY